jgi:hypothetical protein
LASIGIPRIVYDPKNEQLPKQSKFGRPMSAPEAGEGVTVELHVPETGEKINIKLE